MIASGADTFVEVGPGTALSGFMKRIDKEQALSLIHIWVGS